MHQKVTLFCNQEAKAALGERNAFFSIPLEKGEEINSEAKTSLFFIFARCKRMTKKKGLRKFSELPESRLRPRTLWKKLRLTFNQPFLRLCKKVGAHIDSTDTRAAPGRM